MSATVPHGQNVSTGRNVNHIMGPQAQLSSREDHIYITQFVRLDAIDAYRLQAQSRYGLSAITTKAERVCPPGRLRQRLIKRHALESPALLCSLNYNHREAAKQFS